MKQVPITGIITSALHLPAAGRRTSGFVVDIDDPDGQRIVNPSSDTGRWMISDTLTSALQRSFNMRPEQLQYFLKGCEISAIKETHKAGEEFTRRSTGEVEKFEEDGTSLRSVTIQPSAVMQAALLQNVLQQQRQQPTFGPTMLSHNKVYSEE